MYLRAQSLQGSRAPIGVDDRRALFDVWIAVERKQLVSVAQPSRRLIDLAARDIDREVVASIHSAGCLLESDHRLAQHQLKRLTVVGASRHSELFTPERRLRSQIVRRQRELVDPHAAPLDIPRF